MAVLLLALYAEGPSDREFLPPIIQRTSETILARCALGVVEVLDVIVIPKKRGNLDQCILQASTDAKDYHALCIHSDADRLSYTGARMQRFEPGQRLVQQSPGSVCHHLIPIIPVHMTEAWMLADIHALQSVLGTRLDAHALHLPMRIAAIENISGPKDTLHEIVRTINTTRSQRRQVVNLPSKYEPLARQINLNKLFELPSYREFVTELAQALETLHFVPYNSASQILANTHFSPW